MMRTFIIAAVSGAMIAALGIYIGAGFLYYNCAACIAGILIGYYCVEAMAIRKPKKRRAEPQPQFMPRRNQCKKCDNASGRRVLWSNRQGNYCPTCGRSLGIDHAADALRYQLAGIYRWKKEHVTGNRISEKASGTH